MLLRCVIFIAALTISFTSIASAAPAIKIGGLFAVTGPAAFLGEPERNTAKMVIDELNKAGGVKGRKFELVAYDTAGDATKAVQLATKLIKDDKLTWPQVSDLQYWNSAAAKLYHVKYIPQNIFVDSEGKIIKRKVTEEELVSFIEEQLGITAK